MKRVGLLLFLGLTGCPEGDTGPTTIPLPPESVARLVSHEGTVTLKRGSAAAVPAAVGSLLELDVLETGPQSKALVRAPGGREIELGENTHFKVGKNLADIEVTEGTISFLAGDEGDGGVTSVTTKFGRTTVAPGTRATLGVGEKGLAVDVSVGVITQVEEDGGTRSASAGQKLEVGVGSIEMVEPEKAPEVLTAELAADGKVLLKKKGEAKFGAAKKGAQSVEAGTAFQVGPGGKARVGVGGVQVRTGAGVNGTVDSVSRGADGNELGLTLSGPATVALDGKAPVAVKLGGKNPLSVKGTGEASVLVSKARVEVLVGEVELQQANGAPVKVKAGEIATTNAKGAVEVTARPRPGVVLPMGKKVRVYSKRLSEVGLGLPEELTRMQVSSDAAFTEVSLSGPSKDFVAVNAPPTGELFWRTLDDKGEVSATGRVRFMPDTGGPKDEASRGDVVAETGLKASVFFQSAVPTLTFTFPQTEGAKAYRLKVYRASDLKTALVDRKTPENKATLEPGILTEGSFMWSATPLDDAGNEKAGGRMNKMDIIYDNSLTTLQLMSPRDGDRAEGAKAVGVAPLGSKLFVNGRAVALDGSGRFNTPVPKSESVVFRLIANDGSESYWFRRLKK